MTLRTSGAERSTTLMERQSADVFVRDFMRKPKVLILDGNQRSALAATRSLGQRGIPVAVADETRQTLAGSSRFCSERLTYPSPYQFPRRFVEWLQEEITNRGIGVLLPMTDVSMHLVLSQREAFHSVSIPFGTFERFNLLTNKQSLFKLAQDLGIAIPTTYFVGRAEDVARLAPQLKFPVVLKPERSRVWSKGTWIKAFVRYASSRRELAETVARHEYFQEHPFLVQEYIRGQGQGVFALYNRGKPVVFFAHQRLREKPPSGGESVLSESIALNPPAYAATRKILDHVQWHGVAMVEFKVSPEGIPYLMEVNARFWGSLQLAIDAGVDFPWLLYQLATGGPLDASQSYKLGIKNRWLLGDFAHLYELLRNGGGPAMESSAKWRSLAGFFEFLRPDTRYEVNRWDDLRPFLFELEQRARRVVSNLTGR